MICNVDTVQSTLFSIEFRSSPKSSKGSSTRWTQDDSVKTMKKHPVVAFGLEASDKSLSCKTKKPRMVIAHKRNPMGRTQLLSQVVKESSNLLSQ